MVDVLGIELIVVFVIIVPAVYLFAMAVRRALVKGHVWYHIDLPTGGTYRGHSKPDEKGDIQALKGTYHTRSDAFTMVWPGWALPEARFFRYVFDNPWPLKPRRKQRFEMRTFLVKPKTGEDPAASANGGTPGTVRKPVLAGYDVWYEPQVLPAQAQQIIDQTKIFADAYGGREFLIKVVLILLVVMLLLLLAVLARTG